jgi:hypothetical protein
MLATDWWRYPEAVSRIEAMWRLWKHLRLDPATGMNVCIETMPNTTCASSWTPTGAFGKHGDETNDVTDPLPHQDPPTSMFRLAWHHKPEPVGPSDKVLVTMVEERDRSPSTMPD